MRYSPRIIAATAVISLPLLLTQPVLAARPIYAALGDSVAAGLGLPAAANATATDLTCGRSTQAYSTAVGNAVGLPTISAACSGATAGDIFTKQVFSDGSALPAQLNTAYGAGKPQLITITAGANDARWRRLIEACYATNCNAPAYTALADSYMAATKVKLYAAITAIQIRSGTPPTTIVTGYYDPLSASCKGVLPSITPGEISWIGQETAKLNRSIASVVSHYQFARFAPVDFTGHDICAADPWVQGLQAAAPFHPTSAGQQAIAESVKVSLN